MSILLTLHLLALGVWIGVVGAEFAIEFYGMKDDDSLRTASELHYKTDIWVEVPAFLTVLVTGLLMLGDSDLSGLFLLKLTFALLAIFFNCICVYAVFKRRASLRRGDALGLEAADRAMKLGGAIIPTFLVAFALGMYHAVG
jgi:hypothetical protein